MGSRGQRADSVSLALDSRIGVRKHAVLRTAMRGNERSVFRPKTLRSFRGALKARTRNPDAGTDSVSGFRVRP